MSSNRTDESRDDVASAGERGNVAKQSAAPSNSLPPTEGLLFHEPWWLSAASGGAWLEANVTSPDGRVVGRLPFIVKRKFGFTAIRMPPFTNLLGPVVDQGAGKMQTQIARRLSLVGELLDRLPRFDSFKMVLKSDGPDGLAFQDRGFAVAPHYNFRIDWRADVQEIWKEMHIKLRQHIRRAEEKFTVVSVNTPERFVEFYDSTLKSQGRTNYHNFATFPDLFREARSRGAGEILCASWPDGRPAAMTFLAWDRGRTYYVLSMRAGHVGDNSVS